MSQMCRLILRLMSIPAGTHLGQESDKGKASAESCSDQAGDAGMSPRREASPEVLDASALQTSRAKDSGSAGQSSLVPSKQAAAVAAAAASLSFSSSAKDAIHRAAPPFCLYRHQIVASSICFARACALHRASPFMLYAEVRLASNTCAGAILASIQSIASRTLQAPTPSVAAVLPPTVDCTIHSSQSQASATPNDDTPATDVPVRKRYAKNAQTEKRVSNEGTAAGGATASAAEAMGERSDGAPNKKARVTAASLGAANMTSATAAAAASSVDSVSELPRQQNSGGKAPSLSKVGIAQVPSFVCCVFALATQLCSHFL